MHTHRCTRLNPFYFFEKITMITVVGSYNVDLLISVERLPKEGETVLASSATRAHGGKGSNQAVSAARLGSRVTFVGAVGEDEEGRQAISFLEGEGVDTSRVKLKHAPTGRAYIPFDKHGRSTIIVYPGANRLLTPEDLGTLGGEVMITQLEIPEAVVREALAQFGGTTILNPAPMVLSDTRILADTDILVPDAEEFAQLTAGSTLERGVESLLRKVRRAVVVTLGERGAYLAHSNVRRLLPAPKVDAVDETGAGDVFSAALGHYLEKGESLEDAVEFANSVAACSVTKVGGVGPTLAEFEEFRSKLTGRDKCHTRTPRK